MDKGKCKGANLSLKVKVQGHRERKCKDSKKSFFAHTFVKSGSIYVKVRPK